MYRYKKTNYYNSITYLYTSEAMEIKDIVNEAKRLIIDFKAQNPNGIVVIWWATATGKTNLSVLLSEHFDVEIISSDSRQFFKYMDIGTDKITKDILDKVPHHLIDFLDPKEHYTAWQWKKDCITKINEIQSRNKLPMIVGGTWLYVDTIYKNFDMPEAQPNYEFRKELEEKEETNPGWLFEELKKIDPQEADKLHPNSIRYIIRALEIYHITGKTKTELGKQNPVDWPILMLWLRRDKEGTNKRINARIKEMIKWWLIQEVQWLLDQWYDPKLQSMQWIGYKETIDYILNHHDLNKLEEDLKKNTHYLAKKQRTWFRRYIAEGKDNPKKNVTYKVWELD